MVSTTRHRKNAKIAKRVKIFGGLYSFAPFAFPVRFCGMVKCGVMFKRLITSHRFRARVALAVTITLLIPFAVFFTANQFPLNRRADTAGLLFGKPVSRQTFEDERRWVEQRLEQQIGERAEGLAPLVTQWTWEKLMLEAEAKRLRLRVDDQELAIFLRQIPAFQDHGVFRPERYHEYLEATGLPPQAFETLVRRDLLVEKLVHSIETPEHVSDEEVLAACAKVPFVPAEPDERILTDASFFARFKASVREELLKTRRAERLAKWLAEVRARARLQPLWG